jgi:predicted nucleic acid-binding protein
MYWMGVLFMVIMIYLWGRFQERRAIIRELIQKGFIMAAYEIDAKLRGE